MGPVGMPNMQNDTLFAKSPNQCVCVSCPEMYKKWKRRADNFVDVDVDCKCSKVSQVVSCQNRQRESPDVSHVNMYVCTRI